MKRGDKPFSDGLIGHIKLLSNRTTLDERICEFHHPFFFWVSPTLISIYLLVFYLFLVFRREPLWKVSMNIRVHPTVRCSYVPEENVLRIVLKEAIGGSGNVGSLTAESSESQAESGDAKPQEVVVYALKVRQNVLPSIFFAA